MSEHSPEIPDAFNPAAAPGAGISLDQLENVLTLDEIINGARLPERTVRICKRGDLIGQLDDVEGRLEELVDDEGQPIAEDVSLGEGSEVARLVDQAKALRAEISRHTFPWRVRAMGSAAWKTFFAQWEDKNKQSGVKDGFWDAIIIKSSVSPVVPDQVSVDRLRDAFNHSQMMAVGQAAFAANTASGLDIPKLPPSLVALKHEERS